MNSVEVKTLELKGPALDWAVGKALNWIEPLYGVGQISYIAEDNFLMMAQPDPDEPDEIILIQHFNHYTQWSPSRLWSQCGPLLEKHYIELSIGEEEYWACRTSTSKYDEGRVNYPGSTMLIAACRAIVGEAIGQTVSVPKELLA